MLQDAFVPAMARLNAKRLRLPAMIQSETSHVCGAVGWGEKQSLPGQNNNK
jgi:hypothetical protein